MLHTDFIEDPRHFSQENAVVGDGYANLTGGRDAAQHVPAVEHAGAAVDDEVVLFESFHIWEIIPADIGDDNAVTKGLMQKPRNLDGSDVFILRDVGAGLRDQNTEGMLPGSRSK